MTCNLVIQSAMYGYNATGGDFSGDVTATVSALLAKQNPSSNFTFQASESTLGMAPPPSGVTAAVVITCYWQERGSTWTCTSAWAMGQTVTIPVPTPPQIAQAIYSSPNVTVDVTSRLQALVNLHAGPSFSFTVGSNHFLKTLFGTVAVKGAAQPVDPDLSVPKSLFVKYSCIVNGQPTTYSTLATDGQPVSLI